MTLHEEQERVQRAVEHSLAGMKSDPWLTQRVLARAKGEEPVKKVSAALILVIALMLVTMAVGLAAGTGLLDYLFRGGAKPSARQRDLLQSVNAEHSAKGVSIAVTEALASSGRLSMGFSITADQPVWVHLLDVAVNEEDAPPQDTNVLNQFVGDPMSEGSRTVSGGLTCVLSQPIPADAHVKVRLALLVPAGEIVHKSDFSTEEELHKVIGQGKVFLTGDHGEFQVEYDRIAARNDPEQNAIYAQLEPYYAMERALTAEETREMKHLESMMYNMADLYVHYGNMRLLDDFTIDFVLNGDMENAIPLNRAESDGTPVHYGVRVEQAFIDAMGFTLRARLYPTAAGRRSGSNRQPQPLPSMMKRGDRYGFRTCGWKKTVAAGRPTSPETGTRRFVIGCPRWKACPRWCMPFLREQAQTRAPFGRMPSCWCPAVRWL